MVDTVNVPRKENPSDALFWVKDSICSRELEGTIETFKASRSEGSSDRRKVYEAAIAELEKTLEDFKLHTEL